jgi:hypothetical protein
MTSTREAVRLVYGILDENLVLLPVAVATAVAEDLESILALRTYGDARRFEPQYLMVPGLDENDYDEMPDDGDPYHATLTNECQDGNWPAPAATLALDALPEDLDDIGAQVEQFPHFPTLYIDPATEADLLETLTRRGYDVRRDDELVSRTNPSF